MSKPIAILAALAIGVLVVGASVGIGWAAGRSIPPGEIRDELPIFAFQIFMVAMPFLVLAMAGIVARRPWMTGLALTLALWAYYLLDALVLAEPGSGANIGLGLLMLASPVLISVICILIGVRGKTGRRPGAHG